MPPLPPTVTKWIIRMLYVLWGVSLVAVATLSLESGLELPIRFWNVDKVCHFLAYLWLAILPTLLLKNPLRILYLLAALVLFGVLLEIGQLHIPGRMFSFADMGANTAGVFLGFYIGKRCRFRFCRSILCQNLDSP